MIFPQNIPEEPFLCIEASDPKFNPDETRHFLESLLADRVAEVLE
jgi:hypothetical protein